MRNKVITSNDVRMELDRLKALRSQQEEKIREVVSELQESVQPVNIIKSTLGNITSRFKGVHSFTEGLKLGLDLIVQEPSLKKPPAPLYRWIAGLLVNNIIKGTGGEKKFDWHLFLQGLSDDLSLNDAEVADSQDGQTKDL